MLETLTHELRWHLHRDKYRVPGAYRKHYRTIFDHTWRSLGTLPTMFDGNDFNSKIKWLMLFDQRPDLVLCSDKIAVRDYVREKVGEGYLTPIYAVWPDAASIDFSQLPNSFVVKTNHDSGSVWIVRDKGSVDLEDIRQRVSAKLGRTYGADKGEWAYSHIPPLVFAEEYLDNAAHGIADFKFHCFDGSIAFCQHISNRSGKTADEVIVTPDSDVTGFNLDEKFTRKDTFLKPDNWGEMCDLARKLSLGFKYVRVDLYSIQGSVRFGEFTFHPRSGNYASDSQHALGLLIDFDRSSILPPFDSRTPVGDAVMNDNLNPGVDHLAIGDRA